MNNNQLSKEELQARSAKELLAAQIRSVTKSINVFIPPDHSKKMRSYISIEDSIKFALEITSTLLRKVAKPGYKIKQTDTALWHSIIVTYAKPFTWSKTGYTTLTPSCYGSDADLIATHEKLIELRNKFIAHLEESEHEQSFVFLKVIQIRSRLKQVNYHAESFIKTNPSINDLKEYQKLFRSLLLFLKEKIEREAEKIWKLIGRVDNRDYLLQLIVDDNYRSLIR